MNAVRKETEWVRAEHFRCGATRSILTRSACAAAYRKAWKTPAAGAEDTGVGLACRNCPAMVRKAIHNWGTVERITVDQLLAGVKPEAIGMPHLNVPGADEKPVVRKARKPPPKQVDRGAELVKTVAEHPGINRLELSALCGLKVAYVAALLTRLERMGRVIDTEKWFRSGGQRRMRKLYWLPKDLPAEVPTDPRPGRVMAYLAEHPGSLCRDIAHGAGLVEDTTRTLLSKLRSAGRVNRAGRCNTGYRWEAKSNG